MGTWFVRCAVAVCCTAGLAQMVAAQETVNSASVSGRVTDSQGGVVPAASVTARQLDTNIASTTVTEQDGRFRFPYLKIGTYELTVEVPGFQPVRKTLSLTVGSSFDVPISLAIAAVDTNVNVRADAPVLEAARTQLAGTVATTEAKALPMNGRNFLDLALLIPGVSPTNTASNQLFAETSAVPGQGLSVGSQRNFSNSFVVDGLSANDDAAGLSGMPQSVDAVEQFQVVTSGGQAELGRALGGYVNVVTKSGTNTTHGDLYEYVRDDRFNAPNALSSTTLPMHQNQYGFTLGGPVVQNRTFYFGNAERRALDQVGLTTISPANVNTINARLSATGYPGSPVTTGQYPNPVDTTNVLAKIDHQVNGSDQFTVRYSRYDATSTNSRGAGGLSAPSASSALDNIDQTLAVSNIVSLSARTVNETRAQVTVSDLKAPATDPIGPAVSVSGVASFGTLSGSPTRRRNRLYEVVDNVSHVAGAHALRAGVDLLYNDDTITFPRSIRGSYTYSSLATFLAGAYNNAGFTQTFGATSVSQTNPNVGVYAQDEWHVRSSLTVNLGIRYDLQFLQAIHTDPDNVAPRIGFAWSPTDDRRTVVRGGAGIFYDRVPLRALANALLSANNTTDLTQLRQNAITLSPTQAGAPTFPNILNAPITSVTLPNLSTMAPNMQNAYSRQASIEVERQVSERSTVSVGYQYTRGEDLIVSINQNVPTCVASGTNNGCRPVSIYGNNSQYSSFASSAYHGLHVSFVERPLRYGSFRVSYTLSKARDNVGEFFFSSPIDPTDLSKDWGRSDDDQRHRLVINGSLNSSIELGHTWWEHLSHGFQLSGSLQAYSALPLNITSGVTTVQGTAGRPLANGAPSLSANPPDVRRTVFIGRNTGTGPDFFSINLRVSRFFRVTDRVQVEGLGEVFNVTNRVNVVALNGNFGGGAYPTNPTTAFGQVTAVNDPRSAQFAVRLHF